MKIIIFGASKAGQYLLNMLDKEKVETLCFVDNNKKLHNKLVNGYLVQHPSILLKSNFDYVVIASQFANEISKQLHEMGIEESKILSTDIYSYYNILCDKKNKILGSLFKNNIKSKPRIAIINFNNSKYQGKILYENIPASIQEKCEIKLITNINDSYDDFDIIVSSSLDGRYVPGKINYELWHGFPIKQIGALLDDSRSIDKFFAFRISKFVSMIFSYSKTYNHIFNASFFCD